LKSAYPKVLLSCLIEIYSNKSGVSGYAISLNKVWGAFAEIDLQGCHKV